MNALDNRIPCPSEAWDDFVRDMEEQAEAESSVMDVCPVHGEEYPQSFGCASCMEEDLAEADRLADAYFEKLATEALMGHRDADFWSL